MGGGGCSGGGLWCVCIGAGVCVCSVPWKLWWVGCCGGGLRFYRSKRVFLSSHFKSQIYRVEIEDSNNLVVVLTIHQSSYVIWSLLNG